MEWSLVKRKLLTRNQPFSGLMIIVLDEDCYYQTLRVEGNSSYKIYVLFTKLTGTVHNVCVVTHKSVQDVSPVTEFTCHLFRVAQTHQSSQLHPTPQVAGCVPSAGARHCHILPDPQLLTQGVGHVSGEVSIHWVLIHCSNNYISPL